MDLTEAAAIKNIDIEADFLSQDTEGWFPKLFKKETILPFKEVELHKGTRKF